MKKLVIICLIFFVMIGLHACYYDKEQLLLPPKTTSTCSGVSASFANDVSPIIQTSCNQGSGCHGNGSFNGPGALVTYSEITNAAAQIQASIQAGRMPLGSSLSSSQIQKIVCWISNGKLNN